MDKQAYNRWWALHVRIALGEALAEADQAVYEAGERELDGADVLHLADQRVAETHATLAKRDPEYAQLGPRAEKLSCRDCRTRSGARTEIATATWRRRLAAVPHKRSISLICADCYSILRILKNLLSSCVPFLR
jgi:hypothetical protein